MTPVTTIPAAWGGAVDFGGAGAARWTGKARMSPSKASADRVQPDNRPGGLGVAL